MTKLNKKYLHTVSCRNLQGKTVRYEKANILKTSGFCRACAAVRCAHPSFWAHCHAKQSAARPPPIAASLLFLRIPKIKIIYLAARVKSLFLSTLLPRPESTRSDRPSIQSSELGPPTPSTARECDSSLLDPRGNTHSHPDEGVGENQF
jgi:hypothetical protein